MRQQGSCRAIGSQAVSHCDLSVEGHTPTICAGTADRLCHSLVRGVSVSWRRLGSNIVLGVLALNDGNLRREALDRVTIALLKSFLVAKPVCLIQRSMFYLGEHKRCERFSG
jgi:hypothetical protein